MHSPQVTCATRAQYERKLYTTHRHRYADSEKTMIAKTQSCLSLYDPDAIPPLEASDTPPFHCSDTPLLDAGGGHPLTSLQSLHISMRSWSDNVARMHWKINEVRLSRRSGRTMRYYLWKVSSLSTPPNHPLTAFLLSSLALKVNSRHRSYTYSFLTCFGTQYAGVAKFLYSSPRSIASTALLLSYVVLSVAHLHLR